VRGATLNMLERARRADHPYPRSFGEAWRDAARVSSRKIFGVT